MACLFSAIDSSNRKSARSRDRVARSGVPEPGSEGGTVQDNKNAPEVCSGAPLCVSATVRLVLSTSHPCRRHHRASAATSPSPSSPPPRDRKSTRLNSSHLVISYAVFCLKKKTAPTQDAFRY